jgi:hypothetical protein
VEEVVMVVIEVVEEEVLVVLEHQHKQLVVEQ